MSSGSGQLAGDAFADRHIGPSAAEQQQMLSALGLDSLDALTDATVPQSLRRQNADKLPAALSESDMLRALWDIAAENRPMHHMIGLGYHDTALPAVIRRNMLESPGWYTAYTPYQAEISQGRLEMLLNFQHMIVDLTGLPVAGASLLDEATAAAEAMTLCRRVNRKVAGDDFLIAADCLPQTIDVLRTRAEPLGIRLHLMPVGQMPDAVAELQVFGALLQYPGADGGIGDLPGVTGQLRERDCVVAVACDLLALALLRPPGEWGADVAVGSAQRFGVPLGGGGPHAGFMAVAEDHKRALPGRIIGVASDNRGNSALRMALQTREQHIRREKATSNICTAQALPANLAAAWAIWHGPDGIRHIAESIHRRAVALYSQLQGTDMEPVHSEFFDTLTFALPGGGREQILAQAAKNGINLRPVGAKALALSVNECTDSGHLQMLLAIFAEAMGVAGAAARQVQWDADAADCLPAGLLRRSEFLTHPVFNSYRSETEMMRYLRRLEEKDLSLDRAMIGLGSCTMKLNAAAEMEPISWPQFGGIHPFAPPEQVGGYARIVKDMESFICELTGFAQASVQPNAGAQGEYAGLLSIRRYFAAKGEAERDICLVPRSAHGTNPASAVMAGMRVVVVDCDSEGNISLDDLRLKLEQNAQHLAALMVTYPSTHGVFEGHIRAVCDLVHEAGGQVYLDGANFNAMMGLIRPAEFGADVCHLNLHKTFCIPHGGGGPGVGPIAVAEHLAPWLPGHLSEDGRLFDGDVADSQAKGTGAVAATAWGSAGILPISWAFIRMMGADGLRRSAQVAMLNANYLAERLQQHYPVLYRGEQGRVAHECVLDLRPLRQSSGVTEEDVAKRLMDYGFHAPTMSFPVVGTLMVEPTESESLAEIDRFCRAMIAIRAEISQIERGELVLEQSPLRRAPHTVLDLADEPWGRPYSRRQAVFPLGGQQAEGKYWPAVGRIDNVAGDRNLICTCPSPAEYAGEREIVGKKAEG